MSGKLPGGEGPCRFHYRCSPRPAQSEGQHCSPCRPQPVSGSFSGRLLPGSAPMVAWLSPVILETPRGDMDALGHSVSTERVPGRTDFTVGPSLRPSPMGPRSWRVHELGQVLPHDLRDHGQPHSWSSAAEKGPCQTPPRASGCVRRRRGRPVLRLGPRAPRRVRAMQGAAGDPQLRRTISALPGNKRGVQRPRGEGNCSSSFMSTCWLCCCAYVTF